MLMLFDALGCDWSRAANVDQLRYLVILQQVLAAMDPAIALLLVLSAVDCVNLVVDIAAAAVRIGRVS